MFSESFHPIDEWYYFYDSHADRPIDFFPFNLVSANYCLIWFNRRREKFHSSKITKRINK